MCSGGAVSIGLNWGYCEGYWFKVYVEQKCCEGVLGKVYMEQGVV